MKNFKEILTEASNKLKSGTDDFGDKYWYKKTWPDTAYIKKTDDGKKFYGVYDNEPVGTDKSISKVEQWIDDVVSGS